MVTELVIYVHPMETHHHPSHLPVILEPVPPRDVETVRSPRLFRKELTSISVTSFPSGGPSR